MIEAGSPAPSNLKKSDYEYYPRTLAPDDFWGQVRRTVHGVPVDDGQIDMIVAAVVDGLALEPTDVVLDLACGNGALSEYLYSSCSSLTGIDFSEYLISVAKANFERAPRYVYLRDEISHYVNVEAQPERFTKALCYGSFSFLDASMAESLLIGLHERFARLNRLFIGNLPDRDLAHLFYDSGIPGDEVLSDHTEQIGVWRSRSQMAALAARCGWEASFSKMPPAFYASDYRYDVVLTPAG